MKTTLFQHEDSNIWESMTDPTIWSFICLMIAVFFGYLAIKNIKETKFKVEYVILIIVSIGFLLISINYFFNLKWI